MPSLKIITEASLASFRALNGRVRAIGLFSRNEYYEEVATTDTPYLMLPYAYAEVLGRQRTTRRLARMRVIDDAEVCISPLPHPFDFCAHGQ